jgi:hypothetical protein
MPPSGFLILIPTFLFILMFDFPQKPLKFLVEKVLEKWMFKVSSIHVCQCPLAILWQGFFGCKWKSVHLSYIGECQSASLSYPAI